MASINYLSLFNLAKLTYDPQKLHELELICDVALLHQGIYDVVAKITAIPWPIIASIHFRESGQNFECHLHNGDSLKDRTVHVPKGRPHDGEPPFTWIESAVDALSSRWYPADWSIGSALEFIERYNGTGYQLHSVHSPYLWNYTDQYSHGLFVSDGHFDPEKIEARPGCVAILKTLLAKGVGLDYTSRFAGDTSLH